MGDLYTNHDDCVADSRNNMPCKMNNLKTSIPPRRERRQLHRSYPRNYVSIHRSRTGQPRWMTAEEIDGSPGES